ncbi:MAG: 4Fe-4S dicluster domain-containing protein [Synergistaceae bacterium]|jgi:ferredoxin|nr:4Fe-4S dicluster domain-containing protein [Synergistaceae bacterium]
MLKLSLDKIGGLFAEMARDRTLYLPVKQGGQADFVKWTPEAEVCLDYLNTARSIKDFFLPQTENIAAFKREGKKISITPTHEEPAPFVVFGARACDVRSLDVLDRVFLSDPVDTFYKAQRENGVIISMACAEPEETCFCNIFGIDAAEPKGDVATWLVGTSLYWEANTPVGKALTSTLKAVLSEAESLDEKKAETRKNAARAAFDDLPLAKLSLNGWGGDNLLEKFSSPLWEKMSQSCLGCGTCTYVCPTCQCYDIQDFDTGHGIRRFRCWDSCMYSDFTLMAHGNPRKSQLERFRQRFMHKLVYYPANNDGMYSCVGCGRCVAKCPISMNIAKVIKALGGNANA